MLTRRIPSAIEIERKDWREVTPDEYLTPEMDAWIEGRLDIAKRLGCIAVYTCPRCDIYDRIPHAHFQMPDKNYRDNLRPKDYDIWMKLTCHEGKPKDMGDTSVGYYNEGYLKRERYHLWKKLE